MKKWHFAIIIALLSGGAHAQVNRAYIELAILRGGQTFSSDDREHAAKAFALGGERTALQDIRFQFQQLTDVTVRALSPGINDPFTAINAIDALASAAFLLASRQRPLEERYDEAGKIRLIIATPRLEEVLGDAVEHIALYAASNPFVMASLRRVLSAVEPMLSGEREHAGYTDMTSKLDRLQSRSKCG